MKKILFTVFVFSSIMFASKTDIYFGNGIMTTFADAKRNLGTLITTIKRNIDTQNINDYKLSYNQTAGFVRDLFESGLQKIIPDDPDNMRVWGDGLMTISSIADIHEQVESYQNSHDAGNNVIVVAHSQGNLFAIRAYKTNLFEPDWMHIIHIASPSHYFASNDVVFWDNDIVPLAGYYDDEHTAMKSDCLVRKVKWVYNEGYQGTTNGEPKSDYIYKSQIGYSSFPDWLPPEDSGSNSIVHNFTFYMGEPLKEDIANQGFWNTIKSIFSKPKDSHYKKIPNAIDGTDLIDTQARDKILGYIKAQLDKNSADNGDDDNNSDNNGTNKGGDNNGGDPSSFDYTSVCSSVDFPDPIPNELSETINGILQSNKDNLIADIVCPLIDTAVQAYNLQNTGGLPGGGDFP